MPRRVENRGTNTKEAGGGAPKEVHLKPKEIWDMRLGQYLGMTIDDFNHMVKNGYFIETGAWCGIKSVAENWPSRRENFWRQHGERVDRWLLKRNSQGNSSLVEIDAEEEYVVVDQPQEIWDMRLGQYLGMHIDSYDTLVKKGNLTETEAWCDIKSVAENWPSRRENFWSENVESVSEWLSAKNGQDNK